MKKGLLTKNLYLCDKKNYEFLPKIYFIKDNDFCPYDSSMRSYFYYIWFAIFLFINCVLSCKS